MASRNPFPATSATDTAAPTRRRVLRTGAAAGLGALAALAAPSLSLAQSAPKLRVGYWPVAAGLPFFAAVEKGYFKEAGIDVELPDALCYGDGLADLVPGELGLAVDSYGLLALVLDQRSAAVELGVAPSAAVITSQPSTEATKFRKSRAASTFSLVLGM